MNLINIIVDLYNETITNEPTSERIEKLLDSKDKNSIELGASLLSKTKINTESNRLWDKFNKVISRINNAPAISFGYYITLKPYSQEYLHLILSKFFNELKEKELECG